MKTGYLHLIIGLLCYPGLITGTHAAEQFQTAEVQYREVAQNYSADGVVEASRQSTVSAQIAGRVKSILFDVGDIVKKGQVILHIDESEAVQSLAGSQAQLLQSQVAMQNAKVNYERSRQLFTQKFISQAALDKAQADYKIALAQAAASEAGAKQSTLVHGYTTVLAPYSGVVSARLVEVGEMLTVGKPLMTGFDPGQMRVIVDVPQYKLNEIGAHPKAMIDFSSLNRRVQASSVTILPTADARTHSTQVRANLPANEAGIYPGMFVRVQFAVGKVSKLLMPASAVVRRSELVATYVANEKGEIKLRQIRTGEIYGQDEIEVLAGLNPGEKVVLDPVTVSMKLKAK
jgi:RND family efflux transporter MFP subunit